MLVRRDDRAELIASATSAEGRAAGSEKTRLAAQRAQIQALRSDERLEDYDEAGARLGIPGPITPTVVEAQGIVRARRPKEAEPARVEPAAELPREVP